MRSAVAGTVPTSSWDKRMFVGNGIVSNRAGDRIYVTLDYPGEVLEIDTADKAVTRRFRGGRFLRGIALSGGEDRLFVTEFYTNSLRFSLSPFARQGLSPAARRGQEIFLSPNTGCKSCHPSPFFTDSQPKPTDQIVRHDVGTGNSDSTEKFGPAYDTPTLLGLYRSAPYLHHGQAQTLEEVLTVLNPRDKHGVTSHLTAAQIADLVAFLQSLPFEDPEPQARDLGFIQIQD